MNKLEDFTEGSEWIDLNGKKLFFHSINESTGNPKFTTKEKRGYLKFSDGTIGFSEAWKEFTKATQ